MQAWKANNNIDFNFADCQLNGALNSQNEAYIKRKCRERINIAGKYVMLIGNDICPPIIRDIGAIFVPFSPQIVSYAIQRYSMKNDKENYHFLEHIYANLGYK